MAEGVRWLPEEARPEEARAEEAEGRDERDEEGLTTKQVPPF
jgi:hypothetical protein